MPTTVRILALAAALALAACGDDGGNGGGEAPSPPAEGSCPDATSLEVTTSEEGTVTLADPVTAYAVFVEDDTLYGDHYRAAWADFEAEPGTSISTEGDQRAVAIEVYNRDMTRPGAGTFDFEGQQNTYFQPYFQTGGTSQPATTLGEGGSLTLSVADDEQLCGSIDVSDGSLTIRGVFVAPVTPRD